MVLKEDFLQHLWQFKLFDQNNLQVTECESLEIIDVGQRNTDAGPDFLNAKIKIDDTIWAGNVEIHTKSSDWVQHKHHQDAVYDSVILHVVAQMNADVFSSSNRKIPQLQLCFSDNLRTQFEKLTENQTNIRCYKEINKIPSFLKTSWLNRLTIERLEEKSNAIFESLEQNKNNWEETFYVTLARNFGFGLNNDPFELLAKSLPLSYLGKHKDNLLQIEALLFGQSGLLAECEKDDTYTLSLKKEYLFLQQKFNLTPINGTMFKLLRLRPANFPHIRIAQFAKLIYQSSKLFSKLVENPNYETAHSFFAVSPSTYWETHYTLGEESPKRTKKLGKKTIDILLINTVVPTIFSYAKKKNDEDLKEKAISLLEKIPAEKNSIVRNWEELGLKTLSAFDTQAFIQLQKKYCNTKKCLYCQFGHKILEISTQNSLNKK